MQDINDNKSSSSQITTGYNDYKLSRLLNISDAPVYAKHAAKAVGQLVTVTPRGARIGKAPGLPLVIPAAKLRNLGFLDGYPLWHDTQADIAQFFDEYTIRASMATLIGKDLILAAGHAIVKVEIEAGNTYFIPDRTAARRVTARPDKGAHIRVPSNKYFQIEGIEASVNDNSYNDWAILKLVGSVSDSDSPHIPCATDDDNECVADSDLFTLTHPLGLPLKYSKATDASPNGECSQVFSDFGSGSSGAPLLQHIRGRTVIRGIITGDTRFTKCNRFWTRSGYTIDPVRCVADEGKPQPVTTVTQIAWPRNS